MGVKLGHRPSLRWHKRRLAAAAVVALAINPRATLARVVVPLAGTAPSTLADHVIATPLGPSGGTIDWTTRTLNFTSHSPGAIGTYLPPDLAPYGQRRAQGLAEEGLTRLVRALVLGPTTTCTSQNSSALGHDDELNEACAPTGAWALARHAALAPLLYACVHSLQITRAIYGADGSVTLDAALPIDLDAPGLGLLWANVLQEEADMWPKNLVGPAPTPVQAEFGGTLPPGAGEAEGSMAAAAAAPTGIIINARGTGFVPSVWPRVVDGSGHILYGPNSVPQDVLVLRGIMGATKSLDAALGDARVAPLPLMLRALPVRPNDPHTLILSEQDAATLSLHAALAREARLLALVD